MVGSNDGGQISFTLSSSAQVLLHIQTYFEYICIDIHYEYRYSYILYDQIVSNGKSYSIALLLTYDGQ